jgi:hypothetical protein
MGLAFAAAGSVGLPAFLPVKAACEGQSRPERIRRCADLLSLMRQSDTLLAQQLALGWTLRWTEPDSDLHRDAASRRRELDWLSDQSFQRSISALEQLTQWDEGRRLSLMRQYEGEVEAMAAMLQVHNIPTVPPEGWTRPPREG